MARKTTPASLLPAGSGAAEAAAAAQPALAPKRRRAPAAASKPRARKTVAPAAQSAATNGQYEASCEITREDIARLAYTFWQQRGCQGGSPEDDWFRAENELRSRLAMKA